MLIPLRVPGGPISKQGSGKWDVVANSSGDWGVIVVAAVEAVVVIVVVVVVVVVVIIIIVVVVVKGKCRRWRNRSRRGF